MRNYQKFSTQGIYKGYSQCLKNTQKQPKMSQKHPNDQKCQKHQKWPKIAKKHQKWPKMSKITKNRKVSILGGPPGGPPGPEKKSVTK